MTNESVLGHIALRFTSHPENVATEALRYILDRSPAARRAFLGFFDPLGIDLPSALAFSTQDVSDDGIPDLAGLDGDNRRIIILEAKFGACLTDKQPVSYLNRLPVDRDGVLLFVAPAWRISLLWLQLIQRCEEAELTLGENRSIPPGLLVQRVGSRRRLIAVSWRVFLEYVQHALNAEGDTAALADMIQLQGLCNRMDEEAFLPIRSAELCSDIPSRLIQLCGVIDEVFNRAISTKLAVSGGYKSGGPGNYYRPIIMSGCRCYLHMSCDHWAKRRSTPIWLSVQDITHPGTFVSQRVKDALISLYVADPPGVIYSENNEALIPFRIPLGVEKPAVVDSLFDQLQHIADLLVLRMRPNDSDCPI